MRAFYYGHFSYVQLANGFEVRDLGPRVTAYVDLPMPFKSSRPPWAGPTTGVRENNTSEEEDAWDNARLKHQIRGWREQFLLQDCRARAGIKGLFLFTDTGTSLPVLNLRTLTRRVFDLEMGCGHLVGWVCECITCVSWKTTSLSYPLMYAFLM